MRLASLARKINIKPSELTQFLEDQDISLPGGSNTKLEKEIIQLVYNEYAPELKDETADPKGKVEEPLIEEAEEPTEKEIQKPSGQEVSTEESEDDAGESREKVVPAKEWSDELEPDIIKEASGDEEEIELIKAPKITLPGLTVKGKIDLPEPKEKPKKEEKSDLKKRRDRSNSRKRKNRSTDYNPLEAARKRKAREEEQRREEEARKKKEQRRKRYLQEVQPLSRPKKQEKKSTPNSDNEFHEKPMPKDPPKSTLGKFWRWLNS